MPKKELLLRVVHAMNGKGYTFNPAKIAEIRAREEQEAMEEFMANARTHWRMPKHE